jgi:hypothetical protein
MSRRSRRDVGLHGLAEIWKCWHMSQKCSSTNAVNDLFFHRDRTIHHDDRDSSYRRSKYCRALAPRGKQTHDCCTPWSTVVRSSRECGCIEARNADNRAKQLCLLLRRKVFRWWRLTSESPVMDISVRLIMRRGECMAELRQWSCMTKAWEERRMSENSQGSVSDAVPGS